MRFVMMLLGLAMIILAGLWFFTPVLDSTYARVAPGIARSHATSSAPQSTTAGGTRSAAPSAAPSSAQSSGIGSKALAENVMSMINLGSGILGAWFTYMSYRLQTRRRD